jgi:hypothetical protein
MSLNDILKWFSRVPNSVLSEVLEQVGVSIKDVSNRDDMLKTVTVEVLAIGVEDLLDKLDVSTRAQLVPNKSLTREELEELVKRDILRFLERLSPELVLQVAKTVGISLDNNDAEPARVRLFEEIVLLGTEGFLDLQAESALANVRDVFGVAASVSGKLQLVDALMVRIFDLKPAAVSEKKSGGSARRRAANNNVKGKQAEPVAASAPEPHQKKQKQSFANRTEISKLKVADLRSYCESNGLSVDGLKGDLIERVWANQKK